jgi:hypothetical protein
MSSVEAARLAGSEKTDLLVRLIAETQRTNTLLEQVRDLLLLQAERAHVPPATLADQRHERVLVALAAWNTMDLPFAATDVLDAATGSHELDEALREADLTTTARLGVAFRSMRDRDFGGLRLQRDGEQWRVTRRARTWPT